jgi:hypothetical protein
MWVGNFDGSREGLVIAATKARAIAIVGSGRGDFDAHWTLRPSVDPTLGRRVLYTRPFNKRDVVWFRGRCPL